MTYESQEISEQSGAPIELYEFVLNSTAAGSCSADSSFTSAGGQGSSQDDTVTTLTWRYTSAEVDITHGGYTWTSTPIARTKVEATVDQARNNLQLSVARTNAVAELYRINAPEEVVLINVSRYHRDSPSQTAIIWIGRVLNCSFQGARAILTCEPVSTSLKRPGLRRLYQAGCPHVLYEGTDCTAGCKVNKLEHCIDTLVTAVDGVRVVVSELLHRPYAGGYMEWLNDDGVAEKRFIKTGPPFDSSSLPGSGSSSDPALTLILSRAFTALMPGSLVKVFPGCDHTMQMCDDVYHNIENFGGFPYIPRKNPFDGTPIF